MDDYEKYEADCKVIREINEKILSEFGLCLKASGLSEKTINNHVSNIDFYINDYLLYENAIEAQEGVDAVGMFLGYWFIKKAAWANQSNIKGNAVSLKKFYTFMQKQGLVGAVELKRLKQTITEDMPEWLATIRRYNDISIEDIW